MKNSIFIILFSTVITFVSCKQRNENDEYFSLLNKESLEDYVEGDTLEFVKPSVAYQSWIDWHSIYDREFTNRSFKANGIALHFDEMQKITTVDKNSLLDELFIYSVDSSKYIDLYSYGFFRDGNKILPGEVDQMILLGEGKNILSRRQIMFLGISQTAEFAEWVDPYSFLIGLNSRNENGDSSHYEIFLFDLKKSLYTNFIQDHKLPVIEKSYIEFDVNKKNQNK